VVLKTGADGAWFKTADGEQGAVSAVKVDNVVDTVGAGDGFAVGIISALLEGKTLQQAVSRGNKIGSLAIQVQGDSEGLPTRAQLGSFPLPMGEGQGEGNKPHHTNKPPCTLHTTAVQTSTTEASL
jgi:hydroxymethylpyrimidine/phosphomethylpyrimidine kinase